MIFYIETVNYTQLYYGRWVEGVLQLCFVEMMEHLLCPMPDLRNNGRVNLVLKMMLELHLPSSLYAPGKLTRYSWLGDLVPSPCTIN